MQAPASQAQSSARVRLRIQSIKIELSTTSQYPINTKLLSNGRLLFNLEAIKSGQPLRWEGINPIDVDQNESLEIRVYELHWFGKKRDRVGSVNFRVQDMDNNRPSVTARDDSGSPPFAVSVTLVPTGDSHSAAQNAQNEANSRVAMSPSLLESLGRTRDAVETILKIGQSLAELNPVAKAVVKIFTHAWEVSRIGPRQSSCARLLYAGGSYLTGTPPPWQTLRKQDQCDALVAKLVEEMGDVLPHVAAVEDHAKLGNLRDTLKELLRLVEDASRFVVEYKSDGAAVRTVRAFVSSSAQDQVDEFVSRFGRLKESFDREVAIQTVQRVETLLGDAERALLKPLIVPGTGYDLGRCCLEGTRMEIIDDICNWALAGTGSTGLYWLYGPAGCGKSAVSTSVSESLHNDGVLGGSFFCKRDSEHLRKPENVVSDIAASLAHKYPEYGAKLVEALRADPKLADSPMKTRFAGLIVTPIQSIGRCDFKTSTVVVDAIDESGTADGRVELVRCLLQLSQLASWLKVLVTSRPNEEIRNILGPGQGGVERRNLFTVDEASVSRDILAYVRSRMNAIPADTTGRDRWPDEGEILKLSASSNRLFIWARTACSLIQQSLDPDATLKQILAGQRSEGAEKALGEIYTTALNEGLGEAKHDASIIRLCVGAIVLTGLRRPLPDAALAGMLAGRIKPHALSRLINRLGSILYRDDHSAVRMLHQSFGDFMTGNDCPKEYRTDVIEQNAALAESCLQIMLRGLRFNICGLETSCVMNRDVPDLLSRIERNISLELSYSCLYWISHLVEPAFTSVSPKIFKLLDELLLGEHLLYWIEVASLTKELYAITEGMDQIMNWVNDSQNKYSKVASDIYRFLWAAAVPISSSTPHLYVSAFAFGAANFESLQTIKPRFQNTLSVRCGVSLWKLPCIRKIQVEANILCLSLSSDDRRIISGCDDNTVRIWDAQTGAALLEPLQGHSESVTSVAISSDGQRIVSGSSDNTVRVWDAHAGAALLQLLQGHSKSAITSNERSIVSGSDDNAEHIWDVHAGDALLERLQGRLQMVTCVAISSDGQRIVSGSDDSTAQIWDAHTGDAPLERLQGHGQTVTCVAISPDSQRIVSGSSDQTVRVWDAHTGDTLLQPLQGHSGKVTCVTIPSDGQRIISGSDDGVVQIWDAYTGVALSKPLQVYSGRAIRVAISSDGQRVVSGSVDGTVQVWNAQTGDALSEPLQGHLGEVAGVAISSDGRRVVSGSHDKTVRIWDTHAGAAPSELLQGHSSSVTCVAISSDGQRVVSGSVDGTVQVWDTHTGDALSKPLQGHSMEVACVAISSDGRRVVSGSNDNTLRIWDARTGAALLAPLKGHSESVACVAISSDGRCVVSGSWDKTVQVWDAHTGAALLEPLQGHSSRVACVAISSDNRRIVSGSGDETVRIWDAHTGVALSAPLRGHSGSVTCIAISSNGHHIVSGSEDEIVRIWDVHTGAALAELLQGHSKVACVAISFDGQRIISGSDDGAVQIWDAYTGVALSEPLQVYPGHAICVALSSDGRRVVSGDQDGKVQIWDAHTGTPQSKLPQSLSDQTTCVAISSDGQRIVSGSDDGAVQIWDAHTGNVLLEPLQGHSDKVTCVAISSNGQCIVSGSDDKTVQIWNAHTGDALLKPLEGHLWSVSCVAISSDSSWIVSGSWDTTLRIWDAYSGDALVEPLLGHSGRVICVAISSDGHRIISGSDDNTVRIWDAYTGTALLEPLQGHSDWVTCVATSSDGHRIVSGSKDKTVRTWDAHAGAALLEPLEGHLESVTCVAISSDGQYVISGSHDHTVRIWGMQSGLAFFEPLLLLSDPFYVVISPDSQRVVCASTRAFLTWRFPGGLRPLAFQDVFQNSPSSTTHQYFRVMSLQLSMLCDKQGWIRGSSGEPLLWIAPEYQRTCPDYPIAVISTELEDHPVYFDLSRLKIGDDWANIFG